MLVMLNKTFFNVVLVIIQVLVDDFQSLMLELYPLN